MKLFELTYMNLLLGSCSCLNQMIHQNRMPSDSNILVWQNLFSNMRIELHPIILGNHIGETGLIKPPDLSGIF